MKILESIKSLTKFEWTLWICSVVTVTVSFVLSSADISYLPMVFCFVAFLANDLYGFLNWKRMEKSQNINL